MLKTNASVEDICKETADFLSRYIKIDQIIIFGSYAYGSPRLDSDLDIAVISPDIENMSTLNKIDLFSRAAIAVDSRLEIKGFSSRDFTHPDPCSLLELIKTRGKVICTNPTGI